MVVTIKRSKGGSWLGVFDGMVDEPIMVWAGSAKRVTESRAWKDLANAVGSDIMFDITDETWET